MKKKVCVNLAHDVELVGLAQLVRLVRAPDQARAAFEMDGEFLPTATFRIDLDVVIAHDATVPCGDAVDVFEWRFLYRERATEGAFVWRLAR